VYHQDCTSLSKLIFLVPFLAQEPFPTQYLVHRDVVDGSDISVNHASESSRPLECQTENKKPSEEATARYRTNDAWYDEGYDETFAEVSEDTLEDTPEDFVDEAVYLLPDKAPENASDEGSDEASYETSEEDSDVTALHPTNLVPFEVEKWTSNRGKILKICNNSGTKTYIPGDLESGDIIKLCAALNRHGWIKDDQVRWYLVLGQLLDKCWVIMPIATLGGQGKRGMQEWKRDYFKEILDIHNAPNQTSGKTSHTSSDNDNDSDEDQDQDNPDYLLYNPWQPVYSEGYNCRDSSVVSLAAAFIINFDAPGTTPPTFDGCLTEDSFTDIWRCYQHLEEFHPEFLYLISRNFKGWDRQEAQSCKSFFNPLCSNENCYLGQELKIS